MLFKHFGEFLVCINFFLFKKNSIIYYFPRLVSNYLGICQRNRGYFISQTTQRTVILRNTLSSHYLPEIMGSKSKKKKKILLKIFEKDVAIKKSS